MLETGVLETVVLVNSKMGLCVACYIRQTLAVYRCLNSSASLFVSKALLKNVGNSVLFG